MVSRSTPPSSDAPTAATGTGGTPVPGSGGATGGGSGGSSGGGTGSGGSTTPVSGGATGSGGSVSLGSGGATTDAAAPSDGGGGEAGVAGCGAEQVCFDFEDGTAGGKPVGPWSGQGTIDATRAVSGKNALHVVAGGDSAFATLKPANLLPTAGNEYYGRVMFWTPTVPSAHWTFVRSRGPAVGKTFTSEYTYGGFDTSLIANYDTQGVASDCWKTGGKIPLGKWACMEWHFKGATNELELWIDGAADSAAHVVGKGDGCGSNGTGGVWYAPTFSSLELGFAVYGSAANQSVWYDDLVLGKSKIGCPAR